MTGARAYFKKELREILRTYKIYVIPAIFLLLGLMSPILAKLTPDLVKNVARGVEIKLPVPTARDAYVQLLKNLNQLALLAVIFSLIGLVADEKTRGSAALILAKPVPRWSFIAGKYAASAALVLLSTLLSYLACLYYTLILFEEALFWPSFQAVILVMAYYLLILALTLFASTVSRTTALSGAFSVGGFILLSLLPVFHPWLACYSPGALVDFQGRIIAGSAALADAAPAIAVTLGLAAALVGLTVWSFSRQEI